MQEYVNQLKDYIEEAFTDYNDINEDTRLQLEMINKTDEGAVSTPGVRVSMMAMA